MTLKKYISVIVFIILITNGAKCEEEDNFAVELTSEGFDEVIQKNNYFVMFFAPWCGHCKRLHPLWEQLASMMNVKDPKVVIAKVDCTKFQELCQKNEVTGYPTLRLFKLGESESVKFKGIRDMPTITEFINLQLSSDKENQIPSENDIIPPPVVHNLVELTEENFAKHVSSGNNFVKFYAPWCSHCQRLAPTWEKLAATFGHNNDVSIAKIDCTLYRSICQDFEVKGYPTLLWIEDGKKIEKYSGSRDHDALREYVEKMMGTDGTAKDGPPIAKEAEEQDKLKVVQLTSDVFEKAIAEGITFVKFYAPWCGHCQELSPTWDKLAEEVHTSSNDIKIAKVDCTTQENRNLCVEQQVEGYPTLFAYKNGEKQSEYDGSRSLNELKYYINKFVGHDEL